MSQRDPIRRGNYIQYSKWVPCIVAPGSFLDGDLSICVEAAEAMGVPFMVVSRRRCLYGAPWHGSRIEQAAVFVDEVSFNRYMAGGPNGAEAQAGRNFY